MVSFTHDQNIIFSQTQFNDIGHEQTLICGHLFAGHVVVSECTLILRTSLATLSGSACNNWKSWCAVREKFWLYCGNTPECPCFPRVELPHPLLDLSNRQPEAKAICLWSKLYPMGTQMLKHSLDVISLFFKCFSVDYDVINVRDTYVLSKTNKTVFLKMLKGLRFANKEAIYGGFKRDLYSTSLKFWMIPAEMLLSIIMKCSS